MIKLKKSLAFLMLIVLISIAVYTQLSSQNKIVAGSNPGDKAINFNLMSFDDKSFRLKDFIGQPVIINFWATWCHPCKEEMPEFQKFHINNQENIKLFAINITEMESGEQAVVNFINEYDLTFPVLKDTKGIFRSYQILNMPTTLFINSKGEIEVRHYGQLSYEEMVGISKNIN